MYLVEVDFLTLSFQGILTLKTHVTSHVYKVVKSAKSKLHRLLQLKRNGINTNGLLAFYAAKIRAALTYAYPQCGTAMLQQTLKSIYSQYNAKH